MRKNIHHMMKFAFPFIRFSNTHRCGPANSVGIATDYGPDDQRSNPIGDEIFLPSRPNLGPTQSPVKRVSGLSRG